MSYNYDRHEQIQKYKGHPKDNSGQEITLWRKFLKAFLPWITKKWELGNAFLEAKVVKEINEANKIKAETDLLQIQAEKEMREVIDIASYEDEVNAIDTPAEPASDEVIEEEIKEFIEKLKLRYLKYGLKISFSVEYEHQSTVFEEEKVQDQTSQRDRA